MEEEDGSFNFVHRLKKGVNRQSHALKVAKLAGLPPSALKVAEAVLHQLLEEKHNIHLKEPSETEYGTPTSVAVHA
jgi:DNA mismatch repair ATPase MutS